MVMEKSSSKFFWSGLLISCVSGFWHLPAQAGFLPAPNPVKMAAHSNLIVVGRVTNAQVASLPKPTVYKLPPFLAEETSPDTYDQYGVGTVTIQVDRTLLGEARKNLTFKTPMFYWMTPTGFSTGSYGIFFLNKNAQGQLSATSVLHTATIATPKLHLAPTSSSLQGRIAAELANVLATPVAEIVNPGSGVGSEYLPVNQTDLEKAASVYSEAGNTLRDFSVDVRRPLLLRIANGNGGLTGRLWAASMLFLDGEHTLLPKFASLLMKPNPNIDDFTLDHFASSVIVVPKENPYRSVSVLAKLLGSSMPKVRGYAATALGNISRETFRDEVPDSVTLPLAKALEDPDYGVRYHALVALAHSSDECDSPIIELYRGSEQKYLSCWRNWAVKYRKRVQSRTKTSS